MQKYIKKIAFSILTVGLVFSLSCINDNGIEERTFEEELAELDSMLYKLTENGYDIDTTELGVFYIVKEPGEGPLPQPGDTCYIDYIGYFSDGTLFDRSDYYHSNGIWKFIYGNPDMIPGLKSGLGRMNEGAKIEMIIPSNLAYGEKGTSNIPPFTTLIYLSKMHELNPVND